MKVCAGYRAALAAGAIAVLMLGAAPVAARDGLSLSAGAEYTSGDYGGSSSIDQLYVPLTARYRSGRYGFRLTLPFLSVSAPPGTVIIDGSSHAMGGGGGTGTGTVLPGQGATSTQSGLGDIILGGTLYDALRSKALHTAVDVTGKIKFGTADYDKGLGTGENDYSLQGDAYTYLGPLTTIVEGGYRLRGSPPGLSLNDTAFGALGAAWRYSPDASIGLLYQVSQAAINGDPAPREADLFLTRKLSPRHRITGYVLTGLSDASPDWGLGISFTSYL